MIGKSLIYIISKLLLFLISFVAILPKNHSRLTPKSPGKANSKPNHLISRAFLFIITFLFLLYPVSAACFLGFGNSCENGGNVINKVITKVFETVNKIVNPIVEKITEPNKPRERSFLGDIISGSKNIFKNIGDNIKNTFKKIEDNPKNINEYEIIQDRIGKENIIGDNEREGEDFNTKYDGGFKPGRVTVQGKTPSLTSENAFWYDLDIVNIKIDCLGCLSDEIQPAHTLIISYQIKNFGNAINIQNFNLAGEIETPDETIPIRYNNLAAYIAGGASVEFDEPIPRFGANPDKSLKKWAIGNDYVEIKLNLKIENDNDVIFPGRYKISIPRRYTWIDHKRREDCFKEADAAAEDEGCPKPFHARTCPGFGGRRQSCIQETENTGTFYEIGTRYSCPDGIETDENADNCKIETLGIGNNESNSHSVTFNIKQLSPGLAGKGVLLT